MSDPPTQAPVPPVDQDSDLPSQTVTSTVPDQSAVPPGPGWFQRLMSVLFIIFCVEIGLFLLIYPWTNGWIDNYFAWASHGRVQTTWHAFWNNSYMRGGLSGLGLLNLWIAVAEVFRMFSRRRQASS